MQAPADIRYAGVVVTRTEEIRSLEESGWFLAVKDPMPVGSLIEIVQDGGPVAAQVEGVIESAGQSGMRVRLLAEGKPVSNGAHAAVPAAVVAAAPAMAVAPASAAESGVVSEAVPAAEGTSPADGTVTDAASSGESAAIDMTAPDGEGGANPSGKRKRRWRR